MSGKFSALCDRLLTPSNQPVCEYFQAVSRIAELKPVSRHDLQDAMIFPVLSGVHRT
jgi:hypothetical protein